MSDEHLIPIRGGLAQPVYHILDRAVSVDVCGRFILIETLSILVKRKVDVWYDKNVNHSDTKLETQWTQCM